MEEITLKIYGTRGSMAYASGNSSKYGQNTSCIYLSYGAQHLIIDCGTGMIDLGKHFLKEKIFSSDILLSHVHFDHIMGIPFFKPFYSAEYSFRLFSASRMSLSIEEQLLSVFQKPFWPIGIADFRAKLQFEELHSEGFTYKGFPLNDLAQVFCLPSTHPDACTLFKIKIGDKSICYISDYEHEEDPERLGRFVEHCDLCLYDAQYDQEEYSMKKGWGHSTWQKGLELYQKFNIKKLLFFHHDPECSDFILDQRAALTSAYANCQWAKEGDTYFV